MATSLRMIPVGLMFCCLPVAGYAAQSDEGRMGRAVDDGYRLQDFLGREWRNELVQFPLPQPLLAHVKAGHALAGPDGQPVPYQGVAGTTAQEQIIAFLADLDPFDTRLYRFTDAP